MKPVLILALLGSATAALLGLAACGGDDGGSEEAVFDPARGDEIAHQIVPSLQDLPGDGWVLVAEDDFSDEDEDFPDTDSCKAAVATKDKIDDRVESSSAGRAKIEFERPSQLGIETTVQITALVFKDTKAPREVLDLFDDYFGAEGFRGCFNDLLELALKDLPGAEVELRNSKPLDNLPGNSEATAFDFVYSEKGQTLTIRVELYAWRTSNLVVSLQVEGAKEDVTPERVRALLKLVQDSVDGVTPAN